MPKGGSRTGSQSKSSSRGGSVSRPSTPMEIGHLGLDEDEGWTCGLCVITFTSPEAKMLECDRCRDKYCIQCLNKSEAEYALLNKSDMMWFCPPCREKVEKNIVTERKIEEMCKEIMLNYEQRIIALEEAIKTKCSKEEVKKLISESLSSHNNSENDARETNPEVLESVMTEVNERKQREGNVVFFGLTESKIDSREDRDKRETKLVQEVISECGVELGREDIKSVRRLGKFDIKKMKRPLLVTMKNPSKKRDIFKNATKLKNSKFGEVRIFNDLTKAERDKERDLYQKAKEMQSNDVNADFLYKVRGPPWDRKILKVKRTG